MPLPGSRAGLVEPDDGADDAAHAVARAGMAVGKAFKRAGTSTAAAFTHIF